MSITKNFPTGPDVCDNGDLIYEPGPTSCCQPPCVLRVGDARIAILSVHEGNGMDRHVAFRILGPDEPAFRNQKGPPE